MSYLNKVLLIGNVGGEPDVRYTPDGSPVVNFSLATSVYSKNPDGSRNETTEWHRVVFFKKKAEVLAEHLAKGMKVYIEGSIKTEKWQDKQTGQDRSAVRIIGRDFQFLARSKDAEQTASKPPAGGGSFDDLDDDIPF